MNPKTQSSREWRAEQRRLGKTPKLIWVSLSEWAEIKALRQKQKRRAVREFIATQRKDSK